MHGSRHTLQMAPDVLPDRVALLTLTADHQQTNLAFQLVQRLDQVPMPLAADRFGNAIGAGTFKRRVEHQPTLFTHQLGALFIELGELLQQILAAAETDVAGKISAARIMRQFEHVQQHKWRAEGFRGPGSVVAHRRSGPGPIDAGYDALIVHSLYLLAHISGPSACRRSPACHARQSDRRWWRWPR